ncbi:hypothetical protein [Isoptericola sp. NPDC057653]|uniref:hypothetical protein n=1 Tax=Isoptericola sp. NPDC057653 TaxID=3346195 RepID=UPI0036A28786
MTLAGRGWYGGSRGGHLSATTVAWVLGVLLLVVGVFMVVAVVRNARGRGVYRTRRGVDDYARTSHYGDVDRAAAAVRAAFPVSLTVLSAGADLVLFALIGEEDALGRPFWPVPLGVTLVCAVWIVVEREVAFPGVLVPPGARGTTGLLRARRRARSRA